MKTLSMDMDLRIHESPWKVKEIKKRAAYFTEAELEVLMLAYEELKPIIRKKSNTAASSKERGLAWQEITDRVNACNLSGARRTLSQVKMKHKNILHKANRKKAEARQTGGGPPPSEELALSLTQWQPVVDGIPGGTSSHTTSQDTSNLVKFTDGRIVLLDPPETQSVTCDEDEETTSAVTELDSAARSIKNIPGDLHADEGPSSSSQNLSNLPANELYKVQLHRQKKSDLEMDLVQLQIEEKKLAIKKAKLEIELLEHRLKEIKK